MEKEIFSIKELPHEIRFGGDYHLTQSALILSAIADGETIIKDYNSGIDTNRTIELLKRLGCDIEINSAEIKITKGIDSRFDRGKEFEYCGGIFPLMLIISLMAGKNISGRLIYGEQISVSFIDKVVSSFSDAGIDISHNSKSRFIELNDIQIEPVEKKLSQAYPYLKNSLLMIGVSSGRSVAIRETKTSDDYFENLLCRFGAKLAIRNIHTELMKDPDDPRKKIRRSPVEYKKEMMLHPSAKLHGVTISIPSDSYQISAMITLAILKRKPLRIDNCHISRTMSDFINFLKTLGVDVKVANRKNIDGFKHADVQLSGRPNVSRKISGDLAFGLMQEIPLITLLASVFPATALIREIEEYREIFQNPFGEISEQLGKMSIKCGILENGLIIEGKESLPEADYGSFSNPDIALAFYVSLLAGQGKSVFSGFEIIEKNFPEFKLMFERAAVSQGVYEIVS
jgi:3-phosphoshikimate 1-carboxyvinyltransferase